MVDHQEDRITAFIKRHKMVKEENTEAERVTALTTEAVEVHICRFNAVKEQYGIRHSRKVVNLDQSGGSFGGTVRRSKRRVRRSQRQNSTRRLSKQRILTTLLLRLF